MVATPIGNLDDVTLRALRVLREADLIAAEDTRRTQILLRHHGIARPLISYYDAVERRRTPRLVERLRAGERIALVTDAGTPGIADPGYHLVRGALAAGVPVVPVPGPSAVTALVSIAGVPAERFAFEGFLPPRGSARRRRLLELRTEIRALVFLEAGRRLAGLLDELHEVFGERQAVIGRELTKRHEEVMRGTLAELLARVQEMDAVRGEVSVLVAGGAAAADAPPGEDLDAAIRAGLAAGESVRTLSEALAARMGLPRRQIYRRALELSTERPPKRS